MIELFICEDQIEQALEAGYFAMAQDGEREVSARIWIDALAADGERTSEQAGN